MIVVAVTFPTRWQSVSKCAGVAVCAGCSSDSNHALQPPWGCVSTILWMKGQLWTCDERAGVGKRRLGSIGREEKKRGGKRRNVREGESRGEGGGARSGGAGPIIVASLL